MRFFYLAFLVVAISCVTVADREALTTLTAGPAAVSASHLNAIQQAPESPVQEKNDLYARQVIERIAGREKEPAVRVFKNIQIPWFKEVPAEDFVSIMNMGYSRALGVACTHCHVEGDFASDDKRPKRAAREMAVMHRMINEQLGKMQNLVGRPEERFINCAACHRGAIDPRDAGQ